MFNDDFLQFDAGTLAFVTRDEAQSTYARKSEIPTLAGGLDLTLADARYAPKTGSTTYALKTEIPDISGKANVTDVGNALLGKADAAHTHPGVYAPINHTHADYATKAEIPDVSGKANVSDVTTALATKASVTDVTSALAGKADATHTHAQYAPQSTTYSKTEVDTALATKAAASHTHSGVYQPAGDYAPATGSTEYATKTEVVQATGGGLTQTAGDARYLQLTNVFTEVTDIGDQAYAPISNSLVYATKAEIPDVSGKANVADVTAALAGKADATHTHAQYAPQSTTYSKTEVDTALAAKAASTHNHDGTYAPVSTTYTKTEVDTALAGKSDTTHTHAGVYAPVSTTYTKTEVDTALAAKASSSHNHDGTYAPATGSTVYQTQGNMVKVGSETTYYSGAKVDALLSTVGGGTPKFLACTTTMTHTLYEMIALRGAVISTNTTSLVETLWGIWYYPSDQPTKIVQVVVTYSFSASTDTRARRAVIHTNPTVAYTTNMSPPAVTATGAVILAQYWEEQPGSTAAAPVVVSMTAVFQLTGGSWFNIWSQAPPGCQHESKMTVLFF